jgi:hypothetical protein
VAIPLYPEPVTVFTATEAARNEDDGWRVVSNIPKRKAPIVDMDPTLHTRMQEYSMRAYRFNPLAHRLIEHQIHVVLGSGISINSSKPRILEAIQEWWEINDWDRRIYERLRSLYIYGEWLHLPLENGRLADIVPIKISSVQRDEADHGQADIVVIDTVLSQNGKELKDVPFRVIRDRSVSGRRRFDGDIFFFAINRVSGNMRGVGDLFPVLDYLQVFDDMLFSRAERVKLMSQIFWDVTIDGMSEAQLDQWIQTRSDLPPAPGSVFAHNSSVKIAPVAADLKADDHSVDAGLLKTHIIASSGWPSIWFDESGASRASAQEVAEPAYRHIQNRQRELASFLSVEIDWYLQQRGIRRSSRPWEDYTITFSRPSSRELQRVGPAIGRIADFINAALEAGIITKEEARGVLLTQINQLGLTDMPMDLKLPEELSAPAPAPAPKPTTPQ